METVFDHSPTLEELVEYGFLESHVQQITHGLDFPDPLTRDGYLSVITAEAAYFDLYLLYKGRNDRANMAHYGELVPEKVQQYELGFDYQLNVSDTR